MTGRQFIILTVLGVTLAVAGCLNEYDQLKRKWSKLSPPPAKQDILTLHHVKFGIEEFELESARFNTFEGNGGRSVFIVEVISGECVKAGHLNEVVATSNPTFHAAALLPEDEFNLEPGAIIDQPEGPDPLTGANLSHIFYLTHDFVQGLRVEVHSVSDDEVDASLTASAVINGSLYSKPDAWISLRTKFRRDPDLVIDLD